jgi:hypothetical protein
MTQIIGHQCFLGLAVLLAPITLKIPLSVTLFFFETPAGGSSPCSVRSSI